MRHASPGTAFRSSLSLVLVLAVFTAAGSLGPALAEPSHAEPAVVSLDRVGAGELLQRTEHGYVPLPVTDVEVELGVTGLMVRGLLSQQFHNPTDEVIEAVFVFPMPDRSAVFRMELRIGERRIESVVREKAEARRVYEQARETGRKASLLDQHRPNLFTTSVANVNPGETVAVVLEFYEEIDYRDGGFALRFPLTFVPRYDPRRNDVGIDSVRREPTLATLPRVRLGVTLRPGFPLAEVESPSHRLRRSDSAGTVRLDTTPAGVIADRDFVLRWRPEPSSEPRTAVFVEELDGERYLLAMVLPPEPDGELGAGLPTETLYVVDVSGSMAGPSIAQAKSALTAAIERMRPDDRFDILVFNDDQRLFRGEFANAEADTVSAARRWISALSAGGGTAIRPALARALELSGASRGTRAQRIVFLTDGAVADEASILDGFEERSDVRVHTIGIGAAPNTYLMRKMAQRGRGHYTFIADSNEAPEAIARFLERLDRPVMEDVRIAGDDAALSQAVPAVLPDLYAGVPLMLSAKLDRGTDPVDLVVGGYTRAGWIEQPVSIEPAARAGAGVAFRWARMRVESILDTLHEGADPIDVRREVVDLALRFRLVTRYTSLVAVEDRPTALGTPRTARLSAALPIGGTDGPLMRRVGLALVVVGLLVLVALRRQVLR